MTDKVLVVGLGNPGPKYAMNRHNFGFMVVDTLAEQSLVTCSWQNKFSGLYTKVDVGEISYSLLKPSTYMNLSGRAVVRAVNFLGFELNQIIVVHDEIDLPFETMKVKNGGGTAGHKGIASIKRELGDGDFYRVRMGVGRPVHGSVSDYVLRDFSSEERTSLFDMTKRGAEAVKTIAFEGITPAMNAFNRAP